MKHVVLIVMAITFPECPVRMDVTVARIRAIQQVSCVEPVKIAVGVNREEMVVDIPQSAVNDMQEKDPNILIRISSVYMANSKLH